MTPLVLAVIDPNGVIVLDAQVAAIITALSLLVTSTTGLVIALRTRKSVEQVHTLVNSHASDQAQRIGQLTTALSGAGIAIPEIVPATTTGIPASKSPLPEFQKVT